MSYANKKESAKLKSMERLMEKLDQKKVELEIKLDGKTISKGVFYADVLHEMLEYYNSANY